MQTRLPLVLSALALVISMFGATSFGRAAIDSAVPLAKRAYLADTAKNAIRVNNIKASRTPTPGQLLPLGADGKFPFAVGAVGPAGPTGERGPKGAPGPRGPGIDYEKGYRVLAPAVTVPTGSGQASADCKPGDVPVGGYWTLGGGVVVRQAGTLFFPAAAGSSTLVAGRTLLRVSNPGAPTQITVEVDCAPIVKAGS